MLFPKHLRYVFFLIPFSCWAASVPLDISAVRPGPVKVEAGVDSVIVRWPDESSRIWRAEFSLDPAKPLITSVGLEARPIIERSQPLYWCEIGKRRGGWDAFFDFPPSHPDGTRRFVGELRLRAASARTVGDRLELFFDGFQMGLFTGGIAYIFYPGSRLIRQEAVVRTQEQDVAYYYDTGLRMTADSDLRPGRNMDSQIAYYDTRDQFHIEAARGPERVPLAVRYRAIAARTAGGSIAVFPPPHQYFFARDFTTNMGYVWQSAFRGRLSIGVRQLPDDNSSYYPWMNAPPRTEQHLSVFYLVDDQPPQSVLDHVLRYTHRDRFSALEGYKTLTLHWHFAYTEQALARGLEWVPPFKPILKALGVNGAIIMDFHGDGHPRDLTEMRLKELDAYFRACRAQSDLDFVLIPAEEANIHLGGHWGLVFPKPVYWFMSRPQGAEFRSSDSKYGLVYHTGNAAELLEMVRAEGGTMYQTHPRTKGSTGFPDQIRDSEHFRDPRYLGAGWKAMPSDLSSPRLGERALKLLDDMSNWGLKKRLLGEVDVFQLDSTHELYAHMNANYVRIPQVPKSDDYGLMLQALARGDYFISTGEILFDEFSISAGLPGQIVARANVSYTFPLKMAEVVWGDGSGTFRQIFTLERTGQFGKSSFEWKVDARNWKWARLAVWDVAADGAFINPVWRESR